MTTEEFAASLTPLIDDRAAGMKMPWVCAAEEVLAEHRNRMPDNEFADEVWNLVMEDHSW